MTKWRWIILAVLTIGLVVSGGAWVIQRNPTMGGQQYNKESFLKLVSQSKITVQRSADSNTYSSFGLEPGASQVIWTDLGTMDVVFFPTDIAGKVTIQEVGQYSWEIRGLAQEPQKVGSNRPLYFIVHGNLLIQTDDQQLLSALQRALLIKQ